MKQVWWYMSVISAPGRVRQEDYEFKARLGYIVSSGTARLDKRGFVSKKKRIKNKQIYKVFDENE
jgi:hypothetical protein